MRSWRSLFAVAALGFMSLGFGTSGRSAESRTVIPLWVDLTAQGLTVYAEDVPLRSILDEIGRVTGLRFGLEGRDYGRLTIAFEDLPVDEGVRRVLRGKSFFMVYAQSGRVEQAGVLQTVVPATRALVDSPRIAAGVGIDDSERVAQTRREALANPDSSTPIDVVVRLARSNSDPRVRIKALTHLVERSEEDPRVRYTLEVLAADDPAAEVRRAATRLLREVPSP